MNLSFGLKWAPKLPRDTRYSVTKELIKNGRCHKCGTVLTKRKKLGFGTKIIHEECPCCACERISSGILSNDQTLQELSDLTSLYNGLSEELDGHSLVERIQSELEHLTQDVQDQDEDQDQEAPDTKRLGRLIERAIPNIVEMLTETQPQETPSDSAQELSLLRVNLAELQGRFDKAGKRGKQVVAAAIKDVVQQVHDMEIKFGTNQQALQREVDEIRAELVLVRRSLSRLPHQMENDSDELIESLLRRFSSMEAKLEEQDKINLLQQETNRQQQEINDCQEDTNRRQEEINRQQQEFNQEFSHQLEETKRQQEETKRQVDSLRRTLEDNHGLKSPATISVPGTPETVTTTVSLTTSVCSELNFLPAIEPTSLKMVAETLQSPTITTNEIVNCCNRLCCLAEDTRTDKDIEALSNLAIQKILDTMNEQADVALPCLRALGQLARCSSNCEAMLKCDDDDDDNAVHRLLQVSRQCRDNAKVQECSFCVLEMLMAYGRGGARRQVLSLGGIPWMLEISRQYKVDAKVQQQAFRAIGSVAHGHGEARRQVTSLDGIPWILEISRRYRNDHADVQEHALRAIGNVAGDQEEARQQVMLHNGIPWMLELSRLHKDNLKIQQHALYAIGNVALDQLEARRQVVSHGGIPWLLEVSRQYKDNADVQVHTFRTIAIVARNQVEASRQVVSLDGIAWMKTMKEQYSKQENTSVGDVADIAIRRCEGVVDPAGDELQRKDKSETNTRTKRKWVRWNGRKAKQ